MVLCGALLGPLAALWPLQLAGAQGQLPEAPASPAKTATLGCTMSFTYRETVYQLPVLPLIRFWKEIDGIAKVTCAGRDPVRLHLQGGGLSLGVGLPTGSPFRSTNEGIAGSIEIRVPISFAARSFEGEYMHLGGEAGGTGFGLSPWMNKDRSLNMVIYLPVTFNASAAINLQTLELYLLDPDVDW